MTTIHKQSLDLYAGSKIILQDANLKIDYPYRYGLVGYNGCGKSTLLKYIADVFTDRNVYYVNQEFYDNSDDSILELILKSNLARERLRLQIQQMELDLVNLDEYNDLLHMYSIYEQDRSLVMKILAGLGFTNDQMQQPLSVFSGGWRMRVSLARGLYIKPKFLLLDEPTNHLDLEAIIWLTNCLTKWKHCLVLVAHDGYFMDNVCDHIIHIDQGKLHYHKCNFTEFNRNLIKNQADLLRRYHKQQKKIDQIHKRFPQRSKQEILAELSEPVIQLPERSRVNITFPEPGKIKSSNIITLESVTFNYDDRVILDNIDMDIDSQTRLALVGKNGAGKSTLLKLLAGKLEAKTGTITKDSRNRIYYYDQFSNSVLESSEGLTMIEYVSKIAPNLHIQDIRKLLGTIGFASTTHNQTINTLSGGQKMKLRFVAVNIEQPHLLLLDEPTNNLDQQSIESLTQAIAEYSGGVIVITHSIDLIKSIGDRVMLLENGKLRQMDFDDYFNKIISV